MSDGDAPEVWDPLAFNRQLIEEFRANAGDLTGSFADLSVLLLTTTGRHSGEPRTSPVVYTIDEGDRIVFATYAGHHSHPAWFLNLEADPSVTVEVGSDRYDASAEITTGGERDRLYAAAEQVVPHFAEYRERTDRVIPVVRLRAW